MTHQSDRAWKIGFISILVTVVASGDRVFAQSQIVPDNTLGAEDSQVTPNADGLPIEQIDSGAQRGTNLFHSFQEFNVSEGREAYFVNPAGVENILSRVTGTNPSNILGTLGVLGNANLFLINPNGIIFGANARLDVSGSFVASTADSLSFADGTQFSTTNPQTEPLLTVSVPTGLQFGANPGTILVQGEIARTPPEISPSQDLQNINNSSQNFASFVVNKIRSQAQTLLKQIDRRLDGLQVLPEKTLALVGGDIRLENGILRAGRNQILPGGRIELGAVADNGKVSLTQTSNGFALSYENVSRFSNIDLSQQSLLYVGGIGSGDVRVQGNNVTLQDGSAILGKTLGNGDGGEIFVRSQQLNVGGDSTIVAFAPIAGTSGDVTIETGNLTVQNAIIGVFSDGEAATGDLAVRATDKVQLTGNVFNSPLPGGLLALTLGSRPGGDAIIQTRELIVSDGALLAAFNGGAEQGGTIGVNASDIKLLGQTNDTIFRSGISAATFGTGRAGNINIKTQRLTIQNGANVLANTRGGAGGNVAIDASDFIEIVGTAVDPDIASDISTNTIDAQDAGDVGIITGRLIVQDGGRVRADAVGESGTGAAGDITIRARTITLDNQGQITTDTLTPGNGGNINITTEMLSVTNSAALRAGTFRKGNAGNIDIQTNSFIVDRGIISAETASTNGGEIFIEVQDLLLLRNGSRISTNSGTAGAGGNGGNIDIDAKFIIAVPQENSDIGANAFEGRGGKVDIKSQGIFGIQFREEPTSFSDITASSQLGLAGVVAIDAPEVNPTGALVNLSTQPTTTEVAQACTPSPERGQSEFVVTGRGGLPPTPQEVLGTDATGIDWVTLNPDAAQVSENTEAQENILSSKRDRIIEAQEWTVGSDGKIILTAQTPQIPGFFPGSCELS